jgi:hypothetical protein
MKKNKVIKSKRIAPAFNKKQKKAASSKLRNAPIIKAKRPLKLHEKLLQWLKGGDQ